MESRLVLVTPEEARAAIAAHLLPTDVDARLGDIILAEHQVAAARRVASMLTNYGGALLADDVGLGKTFVALAVARAYERVLVIAPAGLMAMWRGAIGRAQMEADMMSYEALSRGPPVTRSTGQLLQQPSRRRVAQPIARPVGQPAMPPAIVILDEAHHARSVTARRYPRIAALTGSAHTLLLTATPVPNRLDELRSLVALFLGARASTMSDAELAPLIVRRTAATVPGAILPAVAEPRWIEVADDSACLGALQRLPPAVPPADGGDGGALLLLGLVRQWSSSRAALTAALKRRLATSLAIGDSLAAGHMPTAAELRAWHVADESMQLAFPELVATPLSACANATVLASSIREHRDAIERLLATLAHTPCPDADRADALRRLRSVHRGERIVCFSEYSATVDAYWRHLRALPGVARLSAGGGEVASGRMARADVLDRFAPDGQRVTRSRRIEEITMLVTTDLLAEGVDLRDATVVVHLDLPWSPSRMEQRVGRARRLGSAARVITVYAMRPPAPAESVLSLERRLRHKIEIASSAVGRSASVLPPLAGATRAHAHEEHASPERGFVMPSLSRSERRSSVVDRIARWRGCRELGDGRGDPTDASAIERGVPAINDGLPSQQVPATMVEAPVAGWLAVATINQQDALIASVGDRVGSDPSLLAQACSYAEGDSVPCGIRGHAAIQAAACDALRHAAACGAAAMIDPVGSALSDDLRLPPKRGAAASVLARVHRTLSLAAAHDRPRMAALAESARRVVSGRLTAGMEHRLHDLMRTIPDDHTWLAAVAALDPGPPHATPGYQLRAIIAFGPGLPCRAPATPS
ncbi:MAG: hypothetical protein H0X64_02605 [Gemmatimonadaceae bacterium]|nr:hypothetical protein [Gemmatimonadaceae bacterium]